MGLKKQHRQNMDFGLHVEMGIVNGWRAMGMGVVDW